MRAVKYLNVVVTVVAVLMTVQVWTSLSAAPASLDFASVARAEGIPDAGAQRQETIDQLKLVNQKLEELTALLRSGEVRVKVEGGNKTE